MNVYYTKCGREFTKSVKADTTGYVLTEQPGQGAALGQIVDPECAACPFVVDVKEGYPEQKHKRFECRAGSKPPNHQSDWIGSLDDKCSIYVRSLDHDLCDCIISYCKENPYLAAGYNQDRPDCRRTVSISCAANKKGVAAKQAFIEKFFPQVNASSDPTDDPSDTEAETSSYKPKCPFLKVISEKSIQCGGFDCKILGNVDFSDAHECSDWTAKKCFHQFLDCEYYRKYYSDPQIIKPEDKRCIRCCNNSWYMGLPDGYDGLKYCFCQRKKTPMLHDNHCAWFDRHPKWPLESTEENGSHLKEGEGMGKMSTANIMDAMKKAKQKTDTLKFAPHPEDLPLAQLQPNPHNKFADQDDIAAVDDIKDNILRLGLINPIAVNHKDGVYYIMSGERRFHAIEAIQKDNPEKFSYVRCTVYENLTFAEEMEVLYAANLKVRHYSAAQRLEYFQQLKDILTAEKAAGRYDGPIQTDIAAIMGVTDRQVRKYDQINQELDDADKQKIKSGELSVDAAAKKAAERRQERKNGTTGSASGDKPDMAFWEPYIREFFLGWQQAELEMLLHYYRQEARAEKDAAALIKSHLNNETGSGWNYSNGNGGRYDSFGNKFQLDVIVYLNDRTTVKKRHRATFTWAQIEKVVRQMVIDGSISRQLRALNHATDVANHEQQENLPETPATPATDLVALALHSDAGRPAEDTGSASADDLYQHTYNDVLRLMEVLKEKDSAGYEEVARLYGKIMFLMRQKGHKVTPKVPENGFLVYCKDCVNCHREQSGEQNLICEDHGCVTTEMDFCSWGEPKENK